MRNGKIVLLSVLALAGCDGPRPPRQPPFPVLDPRAPFAGEAAAREPEAGRGVVAFAAAPLAGRFEAEVPQQFGEWVWAAGPGVTLLTHRSSGRLDVLVYAEPFSKLMAERPSEELRRFRLVAGRALGFRATPGTFSGWKWIGRNASGVEVRLARWTGEWGSPADAPKPARLVFGTASVGESFGAHLAILCTLEPDCPQARDLARLLGSIRPTSGKDPAPAAGASLEDLAWGAGVSLANPP